MPASSPSAPTSSVSKTSPASLAEVPIAGAIPRFELAEWRERYGVLAGITGRGEGSGYDLGLASTEATGAVMNRWRDLKLNLGEFSGFAVARQIHGTNVVWHPATQGWALFEGADGHGTDAAGVLLCVTAADCIPIYLVDPRRRAVGLLHSGWRGTAGRILDHGLRLLRDRCGSRPEDLVVHCGVGICGGCYEVGPEVRTACGVADGSLANGRLDLRATILDQASEAGVEQLTTSPYCSVHDRTQFFSHRGSGGMDGRMVAYLGIIPDNSTRSDPGR